MQTIVQMKSKMITNDDLAEETPNELTAIKQFLLINGFNNSSIDVINAIAYLVYKNLQDEVLIVNNAYNELAGTKTNASACRAKLATHIQKNYDNVKNCIYKKYDYNIGDYYFGVKHFIEQMTISYSIFALN